MRFERKVESNLPCSDWLINLHCYRLYVINSRLYGRPKLDPTKPHRSITKQLLEDIFNEEDDE